MRTSISIRRLCTNQPDIVWQSPHYEIADLIAKGHAEPVITIGEYKPSLPSEGLNLAESIDLFINRHPALREHDGARIAGPMIAFRNFVERPTWSGTADIDKLCRLAGLEVVTQRGQQRRVRGTNPEDSRRPRVIRIDELSEEVERQIGRLLFNSVIHDYLTRLLNGQLQATGVWEGDLATLERRKVPGNWWSRDIVVRIPDCEIWEQTGRDRRGRERRWSDVRVTSNDTARDDTEESNSVPLRSGAPGRPTSMHLIEQKFKERAKQGVLKPTLEAEAKFLASWLKKNHPNAHPATAKTIANRLRSRYRSEMTKKTMKETS